jgi:hypothetical protein
LGDSASSSRSGVGIGKRLFSFVSSRREQPVDKLHEANRDRRARRLQMGEQVVDLIGESAAGQGEGGPQHIGFERPAAARRAAVGTPVALVHRDRSGWS